MALNTFRERLDGEASITLIDKSPVHEFKPTYLRLVTGEREYDDLAEPLEQFDGGNVSFEQTEVTDIDPDGDVVETTDGPIEYDYLIVSLGVTYDEGAIPGFEDAHHVYNAQSAKEFRKALKDFSGGDLTLGVSSLPYTCPAAPVEMALLADYFLSKRGLRKETTMRFFFPGPAPMKKAGDDVANMAVEVLEDRGIEYFGKYELDEVDPDAGSLSFSNGESLPYDLLFASPPHRSPPVLANSVLSDESGWVPVDRETMETDYDNVYAIGDCTKIMVPSLGKTLPKAGTFTRKQAQVAAHRISSRIKGVETDHRFDGEGQCFLAAQYGLNGQAGMFETDFYAEGSPEAFIKTPRMSRVWHYGKLLFEENWHGKWFPATGGEKA